MTQNTESHEKKLKKNTVYNILKTLSVVIFPLITFPYVSRILKPENIGKVNFGNSIMVYFSLIATLGVTTYAVRECSKCRGDEKKLNILSGQILSINIATTIASYILLGILLVFYAKLHDYRILIGIQSITMLFTTMGADWINTTFEDFKYITIRTVMFQIVSLALIFILVREPNDYYNYVWISVLSTSGANLLNIFYRRKYCRPKLTLHVNLKKHMPPILALFVMILAQQVFTACDTTIIGLTLGDYATGLYSTALKIYNIVTQVIVSITWVVMPQLSMAYETNNLFEIKKINKYVFDFTSTLCIPCSVGMFLLSKEVVTLVGGAAYEPAFSTLRILAGTLLFTSFSNIFFNINLLAAGKDKKCTIICWSSAIVNLILNLIFIPKCGIEIAAVTTSVSQIIIILLSIPFLDKEIHIARMFRQAIKPILAAIIMGGVVWVIQRIYSDVLIVLMLSIIIGTIIYFSVLLVLRHEFTVNILKSVMKRGKNEN